MSDSLEQAVRDAQRLKQFLDDEVVQAAMGRLERRNYEAFKQATDDEGRRMAHAKALVLDDFVDAFREVLSAGEHATLTLAKAAEQERKAQRARPHEE